MAKSLKILIAPLDWGLGHTTRCFPLIKAFLAQGATVYLAASGAAATLIKDSFPQVTLLHLPGYGIVYSKSRRFFGLKIVSQIPKILQAIKREHSWLQQQQDRFHFDVIISDNRYGMYLKNVPSVIMTHQLQIQTGMGVPMDLQLQKWHYKLLNKFDECWVVDEVENGIGGILSHPEQMPVNARYIGILSQFMLQEPIDSLQKEQTILLLLSGPEPMRGQLEKQLLTQAAKLTAYRFVLVAGAPAQSIPEHLPPHIHYYPYLNAQSLAPILASSSVVICRSGYSTLMDLCYLGKEAALIPTPGQSEQAYLAKHLSEKGLFSTYQQSEFNLHNALCLALKDNTAITKKRGSYTRVVSFVTAFLQRIL